jgi:hypothetical protein
MPVRREKMGNLMKKEILRGLNILKTNPYARFETTLRERRLKKEKNYYGLKWQSGQVVLEK